MSSDGPRPQKIRVGQRIKLNRCQSWDESFHIFDEESAFAIEMALATGRPLLVRGEPGSGKSQLAQAAAQELDRYFIAESITVASEGRDLLWKYDPVARLSEAQTRAAESALRQQRRILRREGQEMQALAAEVASTQQSNTSQKKKIARHRKKKSSRQRSKKNYQFNRSTVPKTITRIEIPAVKDQEYGLRPGNFISPGVLWWVFDCVSAYKQYKRCRYPFYKPGFLYEEINELETADRGFVLLIDEIDKADPSLPNTLLEVLGNSGFHVPMLDESVGMAPGIKKPLVIITTNGEEELPAAFVRRCLVLNLHVDDKQYLRTWWKQQVETAALPSTSEDLSQEKMLILWLIQRAEVHFEGIFTDKVKIKAAQLLVKDRRAAQRFGGVKPGQAEFLDLLRALRDMPVPKYSGEALEQYQLALLKKISRYALAKSVAD
ncbi:MAG: AAA family ATPase [Candidatus Electrothrix sp. GW3-4]|uniref:AAA family ATPase n=1 Tax=Candidatus Electrothrix sp. GW3-4 TaxID=3126740 RepID=UPI0030D4650F